MIEREPTTSADVYHIQTTYIQADNWAHLFARVIAWLNNNPLFRVLDVEVGGVNITLNYIDDGEHYEADRA